MATKIPEETARFNESSAKYGSGPAHTREIGTPTDNGVGTLTYATNHEHQQPTVHENPRDAAFGPIPQTDDNEENEKEEKADNFRQQTDKENDYLLAGGTISPLFTALSSAATRNSGYMFIGLIGYIYGLSAIWLVCGFLFGDLIAFCVVHKKLHEATRQTGALSFAELLSRWNGGHYHILRIIIGIITLVFLACPLGPLVIIHALGKRPSQNLALLMMAVGFSTSMTWRFPGMGKFLYDGAPGILSALLTYFLASLVKQQR